MATNLTTLFKNIADAIRDKTGSSEAIVAENFPTEIGKIRIPSNSVSATTLNDTTLVLNNFAIPADFRALWVVIDTSPNPIGPNTITSMTIPKVGNALVNYITSEYTITTKQTKVAVNEGDTQITITGDYRFAGFYRVYPY